MRKLLSLLVLTGLALVLTGCNGVALDARERRTEISRNLDLSGRMLVDDIDHFLMLRPASRLTPWHVR